MFCKLYKFFSLIIIIQSLLGNVVSSQNLTASKVLPDGVMPTPDVFSTYPKSKFIEHINEGVKQVSSYLGSSDERAWAVYSDRSDNETYHQPFDDLVKSKLKFMERYFVLEVQDNWLHLVTVKPSGISRHKVDLDLGWIEANKLILSKHPVLSDNGAPKKKMILMSATDFNPGNTPDDIFDDLHYFKNPEVRNGNLLKKYESQLKADKYKILFVIKETSTAVLLAPTDVINKTHDVYGWIHKLKTTSWDTRVCLEPISGKPAQALQNSDGTYKSGFVFLDTYDLLSFLSAGEIIRLETVLKEVRIRKRRMIGMEMRFPVMPWEDNGSVRKKIAVIARLGDLEEGNEGGANRESQIAELKLQLKTINKLANTVNALIVFDGTSSMSKYGPVVAKSIKKIINERSVDGEQNMKWGLAVYRDYPDKNRKFEIIPLNDDPSGVVNMLQNIEYSSVGTSHTEAHYYGMTQAIKKAGFVAGESNVIVLVGDAGNHKNDINNLTNESVIDLLAEKSINLISFQVNFLTGRHAPSYGKFNVDSKSYILESAKKFINEIDDSAGLDVKLIDGEFPNSYSLGFTGFESQNTKPMFGVFNHSVPGQSMSLNTFRNNFVDSVLEYLKELDKTKRELECLITGDCGDQIDGEIFTLPTGDICRLLNLSDKQCQLFIDQGDISIQGFTHMKLGNHDVYTPVAYISKTYKSTLDERLSELAFIGGSGQKARDQFYKTLVSLIKGLVGEQTPEDQIKDWTFDKTWDIILNIPFSESSPLKNKKIKDLLTDNISGSDFENFLDNFKSQTDAFISFPRDQDLDYSEYISGSQTFYWIPFSKIPRGDD